MGVFSDDFAAVDFREELCYHSRPNKQIREAYFKRITAPKKSRAKNNTNSEKEFVLFPHGAEKRIRTSGRVTPVTRFPIVLLKPLRHLCIGTKAILQQIREKCNSFCKAFRTFRPTEEKNFFTRRSPPLPRAAKKRLSRGEQPFFSD